MDRVPNSALIRQTLDYLQMAYTDTTRSEGIHLTDLIYCLTRSYYDKIDPLPPTDEEVMLFAVGLGLQKILVPPEQEAHEIEVDGIYMSPDFISLGGVMAELKTTRQSSRRKNPETGQYEVSELPDTWVEQMKGYCYVSNYIATHNPIKEPSNWDAAIGEYDLLILHLMGNYAPPFPQLVSWRLTFTPDELTDFWAYIIYRKMKLMEALTENIPPKPYTWCKDWECQNCRYKLRCEVEKGES